MAIDITKSQLDASLKQVSVPSDILQKVLEKEKEFKKVVSDYGSPSLKYKIRKEPEDIKTKRVNKLSSGIIESVIFIFNAYRHLLGLKGIEKIEKVCKNAEKTLVSLNQKKSLADNDDNIMFLKNPNYVSSGEYQELVKWKDETLNSVLNPIGTVQQYLVEVQLIFEHAYTKYEEGYKAARQSKESVQKHVTDTLEMDNDMFKEQAQFANKLLKMYKEVDRSITVLIAENPTAQRLKTQQKKVRNPKLEAKLRSHEIRIKDAIRDGKYAGKSMTFARIDFAVGECAKGISSALKLVSTSTTLEIRKKALSGMVTQSGELLGKINSYFEQAKDTLPNKRKIEATIKYAREKLAKESVKASKSLEKLEAKMDEFNEAMEQYRKEHDPKRKLAKALRIAAIAVAVAAGIAAGVPTPVVTAVTSQL